jgi:YgiT-type zinc finger domain-containing protein
VREERETVPYTAAGPCVVELRNVTVRRCSTCGEMHVEVPDAPALDVLVRCLRVESTHATPQLEYEGGHWRISGRDVVIN